MVRSLVFLWQLAFAREASDVGKGNPATNLFLPTAAVKPPHNSKSKGRVREVSGRLRSALVKRRYRLVICLQSSFVRWYLPPM